MGAIGCITIANVFSITISEPLRLIKRIHVAVLFFAKKFSLDTMQILEFSHYKYMKLII